MKNNKGFTLIEILAVVVILAILFTIGIAAYTTYINKAKKDSYDTMAHSAENAMENYIMDHPGITRATFDQLAEGEYLQKPVDPSSRSEYCKGKVIANPDITVSGTSIEKYNYTVSICCADHNATYSGPGKGSKDQQCKLASFGTTAINQIKAKKIKVLYVYPISSVRSSLQTWMNSAGLVSGTQVMQITNVAIDTFNSNPDAYLGTNGDWKADVVVFGFYECYNNKDLTPKSAKKIGDYMSDRGSVIFSHDTITTKCGNHKNFNSLQDRVGIKATNGEVGLASTKVTLLRSGTIMTTPNNLGSLNSNLTISSTHVNGQTANGANVWLTFQGMTGNNSIYLATYENSAFIQMGNSGGTATAKEQQILANTIFYLVAQHYGAE